MLSRPGLSITEPKACGRRTVFGPEVDARLPFDSLVLAGFALLCFVALPMPVAAVAGVRSLRHSDDLVLGAGLLLVAWIGVELAHIKVYSWFHPYLGVAFVVMALGWLLSRLVVATAGDRSAAESQLRR